MEDLAKVQQVNGKNSQRRFTREEDEKIMQAVASYGTRAWEMVAGAVGGGRNTRQVRERWNQYLRPTLELGYTQAEDARVLELVAQYGRRWAMIGAMLRTKSDVSVRNRYRILAKQSARKEKLPTAPTFIEPQVQISNFDRENENEAGPDDSFDDLWE
jgi:hypothetical protein